MPNRQLIPGWFRYTESKSRTSHACMGYMTIKGQEYAKTLCGLLWYKDGMQATDSPWGGSPDIWSCQTCEKHLIGVPSA